MGDEQILQPGVKEGFEAASKAFWDHVDCRMPQVVNDRDRPHVAEALLLAIAAYRVAQENRH